MSAKTDGLDFLTPAQSADEMGRLGPYRVLKVLGQGGMGVVFLAEDPALERTVALKAMLPDVARKATARERFLREARATAKIEHDHIVTIYQVGEDRGVPFLAMQLLKGMSLEDFLKKKHADKPMSPGQVMKLGREIAKGLSAAHEKGLIHRDIKPGNIWLDSTAGGRVKILDFGLARAAEGDAARLTTLGTIVGTAAYMAPEQACGVKLDGRADLFSLGCVLYRLCTGKLPWKGIDATSTMVAIAVEDATPVQELNPELSPKFASLIMKLLAKKAEDRPASAKAVVEAIQAMEAEQPTMTLKAMSVELVAAPTAALAASGPASATEWHDAGEPNQTRRSPARGPGRTVLLLGAAAAVAGLFILGAITAAILYARSGGDKPNAMASAKDGAAPKKDARPADPKRTKDADRKDSKEPRKDGNEPRNDPKETPAGDFTNSIGMKLHAIEPGKFLMGTSEKEFEQIQREPNKGYDGAWFKEIPKTEFPQREVPIEKGFHIGIHEVTQGQFQQVMGSNPSANKESPNHPVENLRWVEAMEFCKRLSARADEKGRVYRLPTEAEWEYCCRAGTTTLFAHGNSLSAKQANIDGLFPFGPGEKIQTPKKTTPVGNYAPNDWGLYDMHGNVWEWCADTVDDPMKRPGNAAFRVLRGGACYMGAVRAAYRKVRPPDYRCGLRVVCDK